MAAAHGSDRADRLLRIGVVGTGAIGRRHARHCIDEPSTVLAGIVDPAPSAAEFASELGVAHYSAVEDMLRVQEVDGVIVAVPTQLHRDIALNIIEKGVHVLIEKPIAVRPEEAAELISAARSTGAKILVGHHRRHNPTVSKARELIGRDIGKLLAVNVTWSVLKPVSYFEPEWRRSAGAGPVLTNLIHDVDLLRFLCGEVTSVSAIATALARNHSVEDTVAVMLRFASGAVGTIVGCDASPSRGHGTLHRARTRRFRSVQRTPIASWAPLGHWSFRTFASGDMTGTENLAGRSRSHRTSTLLLVLTPIVGSSGTSVTSSVLTRNL